VFGIRCIESIHNRKRIALPRNGKDGERVSTRISLSSLSSYEETVLSTKRGRNLSAWNYAIAVLLSFSSFLETVPGVWIYVHE
jgi:hypothetical protein